MNEVKVSTNAVELRDDMLQVYAQLRNGTLGMNEAKQAANVAGKIFSSVKIQIEYNKMVGSKKPIIFTEC